MTLFSLEDNKIKITTEALLIPNFKIIYDRDTSKSKEKAISELSYIYFMADYKSIYLAYPESTRNKQIQTDIIKDDNWKPDDAIKAAIRKYEELQETPALRMLKGARNAAEAVTEYYQGLGQSDTKANSKNVQAIMASLEKLGKVVESIDKLEDKIRREVQTEGRSKAGREINPYEE